VTFCAWLPTWVPLLRLQTFDSRGVVPTSGTGNWDYLVILLDNWELAHGED
jgi:hypothetical protein